tara:strand:+ start:167 stop:565 length:399 start_codon:yes stop_codon:yes gene_type:complete
MKNKEIILPSNRKFGVVFSIFFILVAIYFFYKNSLFLTNFFVFSSFVFCILTLFFTSYLSPLNFAWYKFGILLGKIVNPLVMGILFYLMISPVAILSRLFGRDELKIKESKKNSYWIDKKVEKNLTSFKNQY